DLRRWADEWASEFDYHQHFNNCHTFIDAFYTDFMGHEFASMGMLAFFLDARLLAGTTWWKRWEDEFGIAAMEAFGTVVLRLGVKTEYVERMAQSLLPGVEVHHIDKSCKMYKIDNGGNVRNEKAISYRYGLSDGFKLVRSIM
ncbi:hypothetical protein HK097_002624, partial [Rhizophlyctis rosea]